MSGINGDVEVIGATMPIEPTASPWYSAPIPTAPPMPASTAQRIDRPCGGACQRTSDDRAEQDEPGRLRDREDGQHRRRPGLQAAEEVGHSPRCARGERQQNSGHAGARLGAVHRPRGGDRVELVRVVEDGRLGRLRRAGVVVAARPRGGARPAHPGRARPRAPRSAACRGGRGRAAGPRPSAGTPGRARARRCGRCRAGARRRAAGRHGAAGAAGRARGRSSRRRPCARAARRRSRGARRVPPAAPAAAAGSRASPRIAATVERSPSCEISPARNSRKPSSSSGSRRIAGAKPAGSSSGSGLDRAHVELEPVAVALDAPEHANRVALVEPRVEQVDVVPDASLDATARVDELEREVRRPALRPQPPLARDRVDPLDDAILGQLGDACSSGGV